MNRKISMVVSLILAMFMMLSTFAFGLSKTNITKIGFDKTGISLEVGSTFTPVVTLTPSTALKNQLKWSSSNSSVAVVNYQGTISALKAGTAQITAKSSNSEVSASITVTVTEKKAAVEIKVPIFERGRQGEQPADSGYWAKYIKDKVLKDLNISIKWVSIARPNPAGTKAAYNLLIAAGSAPDIITEYDASDGYMAWLGQGVFQEIPMELINQYAPNYVKYEGASIIKFGKIQGKQWFLPAKRPIPLDATSVTMIRQDWLDKVGLSMPKTTDDLYNVLKAFKAKDPGNVGVNRVVPMTIDLNGATVDGSATGNYIFRPSSLSDLEKFMYSDVSLPALTWEPEKKRLQWLNKLYNDGLISQEFMLDLDNSKARSAFMNGYGGIWKEYLNQDAGYIAALMKNIPTAKLSTLYPYTATAGRVSTSYYYTPPVGLVNGINKNCKNVPEVLKFLDWMSKPENLSVLQFGNEGTTYTVNGGKKALVANYRGKDQLLNGSNKDYYALVVEGVDMGSDYDNMMAAACPAGEDYRYLMQDQFKYLRKPFNMAVQNIFIPKVITNQTTYASSLVNKFKQYATQLIVCNPGDFETKYAQFSKDYLDSGYQKILDEKKTVYQEWNK
jgi:putative aldouronate transport system substrate-binding protein